VLVELGARRRQRGAFLPYRALGERGARLDRLLLALGRHSDEIAIAHHGDYALHAFHGRFIERSELRPR
jgi:hypothetical protein